MKRLTFLLTLLSLSTFAATPAKPNPAEADREAAASSASTAAKSVKTKGAGEPNLAAKSLPEIKVDAKSIGGVTTWVVANPKIKAGKTYLLVAHADLPTGPAEHGLEIKDFGIHSVVKRGVPYKVLVNVPADKKGEVKITCFLHPKHKEAVLTVE